VNAVTATKSKWDRAMAASDSLNAGDWYLPHPSLAAWVGEFLLECSGFPTHKHDDYVDAWSQASGEFDQRAGLQHVH
jgi:predicted phage terminase large subunit-like protein